MTCVYLYEQRTQVNEPPYRGYGNQWGGAQSWGGKGKGKGGPPSGATRAGKEARLGMVRGVFLTGTVALAGGALARGKVFETLRATCKHCIRSGSRILKVLE